MARSRSDPDNRTPERVGKTLGRQIAQLRELCGVESSRLAGEVGVSVAYMHRIERGQRPPARC